MKMAKSIVQSFSLDITEAATLTQAEDKARQQGKSFSKYLVNLIKEDLEKNAEALERLPILSLTTAPSQRQTTITEYDIKLFQPYPERISNMRNLSKDQQTKLQIDLNHMQQEIKLVRKY
jgi:S-ribosylhomocysteine lyase LuxS involved in autoinducer biosynthesis